jgi:hypothetical protein
VSNNRSGLPIVPSQLELNELLHLGFVQPVTQLFHHAQSELHLIGVFAASAGTQWRAFWLAMRNDQSFSPSWQVTAGDKASTLFYLRDDDVFLLIEPTEGENMLHVDIVFRQLKLRVEESLRIVQKLINFMLHFIWSDMLSSYR